jgi:hypothetical protein
MRVRPTAAILVLTQMREMLTRRTSQPGNLSMKILGASTLRTCQSVPLVCRYP